MAPRDEDKTVELQPDGVPVSVESMQLSARGQITDVIWWNEDEPVFPHGKDASPHYDAALDVMTRMRAGKWPPDGGRLDDGAPVAPKACGRSSGTLPAGPTLASSAWLDSETGPRKRSPKVYAAAEEECWAKLDELRDELADRHRRPA